MSFNPLVLFHFSTPKEIDQAASNTQDPVMRNALRALYTLLTYTDRVFSDWQVFEKTALSLSGILPDPEHIEPPTLEQVALLFLLLRKYKPHEPIVISEEVEKYLQTLFKLNELYFVPDGCLADLAELEIPLPDTLEVDVIEEAKSLYDRYKDNPEAFFKDYPEQEILVNPALTQAAKALYCDLYLKYLTEAYSNVGMDEKAAGTNNN
jgi:hypothetical protein